METAPFACGICAEKFKKLGKFYMHLGEHNVLIQKEFHICNEEVSSETQEISRRKKRSSNKRVNNGGKEDSTSTTALYICKACSCTFSTLCVLHSHVGRCFGGGSYIFDADHNTAYPIKSICSFFEARNDIHDDADVTSNNSDCETVIYEDGESPEHDGSAEALKDIIDNEHTEGRNTEPSDDAISLERDDHGKTILCVKEEPSDALDSNTDIPNEIEVNDKTENSVTQKEIASLVTDLFGIQKPSQKPHTKISSRGRKIILKEYNDAPKQNVKKNIIIKSEKSKVKKRASKRKSEQISSEDKSVKSNEDKPQKTLHQCLICEKVFKFPQPLKDHQFSHTKELAFKCELCPKAFWSRSTWRDHRYSHNTELSYPCEICGERFPVIYRLNKHIKWKHAKEKPHKCKTCGAAFIDRNVLIRHELQHSEERQHQCEVCGRGFTRREYLDQHRLTQHDKEKGKRFPCDQCERRFLTNYALQCHLKVHTGERPFPCKLCKSAYIQRKELRKHMKTRHGLNLDGMVITGEAEKDDKALQTGLVAELPGEVVEDGIVHNNVRNQSNVYEDMDTQSTDYQIEETQSAVISVSQSIYHGNIRTVTVEEDDDSPWE